MNTNSVFASAMEEINFEAALKNAACPSEVSEGQKKLKKYLEETMFVYSKGLASLAEKGVDVWEDKTENYLPHNLIRSQMSNSVGEFGPDGKRVLIEDGQKAIEFYARFGGWLREAANFKALRKAIERGQSGNGINSSRTRFDLKAFFMLYKSPGAADFALRKCNWQAREILSAYKTNNSPSWAVMANALVKTKGNARKAAFIAVVEALFDDEYGDISYRKARDLLSYGRTARFDKELSHNGKTYRYDSSTEEVHDGGICTYLARYEGKYGYKFFTLATDGKKNYVNEYLDTQYTVNQAIEAWKDRDPIEDALFCGYRGFVPESAKIHLVDELPIDYPYGKSDYGGWSITSAFHDGSRGSVIGRAYAQLQCSDHTYLVCYNQSNSSRGRTTSVDVTDVYITSDTNIEKVVATIDKIFSYLHGKEYLDEAKAIQNKKNEAREPLKYFVKKNGIDVEINMVDILPQTFSTKTSTEDGACFIYNALHNGKNSFSVYEELKNIQGKYDFLVTYKEEISSSFETVNVELLSVYITENADQLMVINEIESLLKLTQ